ncbi:MAG: hypothetical protein ACYDBV_12090 [Nitrospiria bacterium]
MKKIIVSIVMVSMLFSGIAYAQTVGSEQLAYNNALQQLLNLLLQELAQLEQQLNAVQAKVNSNPQVTIAPSSTQPTSTVGFTPSQTLGQLQQAASETIAAAPEPTPTPTPTPTPVPTPVPLTNDQLQTIWCNSHGAVWWLDCNNHVGVFGSSTSPITYNMNFVQWKTYGDSNSFTAMRSQIFIVCTGFDMNMQGIIDDGMKSITVTADGNKVMFSATPSLKSLVDLNNLEYSSSTIAEINHTYAFPYDCPSIPNAEVQ